MRLRKIRLSGFKSFVDPTTLIVPGNLVGIVGPNGCGKSNIIDAVTWVMGESSAKHLRGDSLTDVIFNGTNSRQPVGQASVELEFDNSEHRIGGQYASYNEISVKRQINREGLSTYFLNGTRCRRKDIQGLFLGTGLGPRSYAIIEQGMISRLIEARPEELRTFIEEAAGISRYRERRRETENRMRHTRENLARLNDIREELDKQLQHLQRQARAAGRYQELKAEERQLRAELLALNWRELKQQSDERVGQARAEETRVEEAMAGLRRIEAEMEAIRDRTASANDAHNRAQSRFYEVGADISQLEQKLQHADERIQSLSADLAKTGESLRLSEEQRRQDRDRLAELGETVRSLEPQLKGSRSESTVAYDGLNQAEQAIQQWQAEWDAINEAAAGFSRQLEVDATRTRHLEEGLEEMSVRRHEIGRELKASDAASLQKALDGVSAELKALEKEVAASRKQVEARFAELGRARQAAQAADEALATERGRAQELGGEIASLESLLAGGGAEAESVAAWCKRTGLAAAPRLVDAIQVDPAWSLALETALGARLQDRCIRDLDAALRAADKLEQGQVGLLAGSGGRHAGARLPRLLDRIRSEWPLESLLGGVYIADTLAAAMRMRASLEAGESVVTRDGVWLGKDWARINRPADAADSLLAREQKLKSLRREQQQLGASMESRTREQEQRRAAVAAAETAIAKMQESLGALMEQLAALRARQAEARVRLEEAVRRRGELGDELEDLDAREKSDSEELEVIRKRVRRTGDDHLQLTAQREKLAALRAQHRSALDSARSRWQSTHEQSHELALRIESMSSQRASLEHAIGRSTVQIGNLQAREAELEAALAAARAPVGELRGNLEQRLAEKITAERELAAARGRVQELDAQLRDTDRARSEVERGIEDVRSALENARLAAREAAVRLETVRDQLQAVGQQPEQLLATIDEATTPAAWQERLDGVDRRIQRLGAINLAAIEEFQQLSQRKEYMDRQHADLSEALNTLENAIRKIDRETRTRFKETFDRLNANLKEMFPILFGGGHAYLEMTGDDLLETGVTIMARPPGKKNSNIHLLSGGEKALTAVALVFAIFKLNPAPFCILDEVDAPLDDTNVGRFSNLVTEMSRDVQFIVVTHNKITMEIAQQLTGVTMHEPGVSRLVTVDMEEAVQMAASA
jgi:chromosome segregation protein